MGRLDCLESADSGSLQPAALPLSNCSAAVFFEFGC